MINDSNNENIYTFIVVKRTGTMTRGIGHIQTTKIDKSTHFSKSETQMFYTSVFGDKIIVTYPDLTDREFEAVTNL